ncbi:DUF3168 domain-containing protein [Microvirga sp. Mcv34]|uniref:DUF3168 domain-containing protein n=1 Tax=Microvirga sp. Mcv34 TaxID=2926016 RepID=UPI0021C95668|nr:DUF3168 domain-containing protein [Microvirga sp. Mcv34]
MSDPSLALQGAVINTLRAAGTEAGQDVFDTVPARDPFPRITVGSGQTIPADEDCYEGSETFMQVDVWSREPGYPQVKRIAWAVRQALHNKDIGLIGHTLELLKVTSTTFERDPDGLTSRARMTLRALTQPAD